MTQKELIRQEIERRLKYTHDWLRGDEKRHPKQIVISKNYYKMKGDERTLDALLSFVDSLPEEKPSDDLEEAARLYAIPHYMRDVDVNYLEEYPYDKIAEAGFIAGAQWMENQFEHCGSFPVEDHNGGYWPTDYYIKKK